MSIECNHCGSTHVVESHALGETFLYCKSCKKEVDVNCPSVKDIATDIPFEPGKLALDTLEEAKYYILGGGVASPMEEDPATDYFMGNGISVNPDGYWGVNGTLALPADAEEIQELRDQIGELRKQIKDNQDKAGQTKLIPGMGTYQGTD